jgi:hypothetical protein
MVRSMCAFFPCVLQACLPQTLPRLPVDLEVLVRREKGGRGVRGGGNEKVALYRQSSRSRHFLISANVLCRATLDESSERGPGVGFFIACRMSHMGSSGMWAGSGAAGAADGGELEFTLDPFETSPSDARKAFFKKSPLDWSIESEVEKPVVQAWRLKERMKTMSVALVACLNIRVDPPDVIKPSPCARMECWMDPYSVTPAKALEQIGKKLEDQYQRWQPRARYKQSLDPTVDDVKKLCDSLRRSAKDERVLFHYNGHGVPKPTNNSEIWVFNKNFTQYIPLSVYDLETWSEGRGEKGGVTREKGGGAGEGGLTQVWERTWPSARARLVTLFPTALTPHPGPLHPVLCTLHQAGHTLDLCFRLLQRRSAD